MHSKPKYSTTDHWIQKSIKRIFSSGLFWAVGAAEKKNCHKYATFEVSFLYFHGQIFFFFFEYCSLRIKKLHSIEGIFFFKLESILFWVKIGYRLIL